MLIIQELLGYFLIGIIGMAILAGNVKSYAQN
mgnify:CR=1 FL=1